MSTIFKQYQRLTRLPAGGFLFDKAIGLGAPFFGKIRPKVKSLRPGYCEVEIKDRWGVRNHLGTINAGALCSLAELTGGLALDSLLPDNMRWIPRGMTVAYLKKATGTQHAVSQIDAAVTGAGDMVVPIVVKNDDDITVFTADITFYLSIKKTDIQTG